MLIIINQEIHRELSPYYNKNGPSGINIDIDSNCRFMQQNEVTN